MPSWSTRADALRIVYQPGVFDRLTGFLKCVGTIPGVAPIAAAGLCGGGIAAIASHNDGMDLCFRAPDSGTFGALVRCDSDGDYMLEDGEDKNKWLRIKSRAAFLSPTPQQARVFLKIEDGEMVTEKAPSTVTSLNLQLQNVSSQTLENVRVWCPTPDTTFNLTGLDVAAADEASSLLVGALAVGGVKDLGMKLTVLVGADPAAAAPFEVYAKWDSF
jgi:hypothetical protein